jgi:hypothetical protein
MLEITFSEIADGWAVMALDLGRTRLSLHLSWETELFSDLADLALAMLKSQPTQMLEFTNEHELFKMTGMRQSDGLYLVRAEQWEPYFDSMQGRTMTESWELAGVEPWQFGFQLWSELARVKSMPGVLHWRNDEEGCLPEGRFNKARNAKIAELEQALMG